jgi:hypothetical protein
MTDLPLTSDTRPSNVVRFEQLMYLALGAGVVQSMLQWSSLVNTAHAAGRGIGFVLQIQMFVFAFSVLFIWLIARRRKNWARWVWLVFFILGIPLALPTLGRVLRSGPIAATLMSAQNFANGSGQTESPRFPKIPSSLSTDISASRNRHRPVLSPRPVRARRQVRVHQIPLLVSFRAESAERRIPVFASF